VKSQANNSPPGAMGDILAWSCSYYSPYVLCNGD